MKNVRGLVGLFWLTIAAFAFAPACGSDDGEGSGGSSGSGSAAGAAGGSAGSAASAGEAGTSGSAGQAGAAGAAGSAGQGWDARFDAFAEALQKDLAASDAFGVSAAVLESGQVTFAQAFGSKDHEGNEPLLPSTLMQIGSTTKQMTAVALLRNVEAGQVSLDDNLSTALPSLSFTLDAGWTDEILVRHLLTHQGAFYDYTPWDRTTVDGDLAAHAYGPFAQSEFLMAPPGAFWNYANPNFIVAGLISQELDTRMWPDILVEDVFQPLGMTRTFLRKSEVEADGDYALSYGLGSDALETGTLGPVEMANVPDPAFTRPAGLAWSTPTQMAAWADFLIRGNPSVLSDALREQITEAHVDTLYLPGHMAYGFGMFVWDGYLTQDGTWYEVPVWEHGGNTLSFSNLLFVLPDQDFAVIITSSGYTTDFDGSVDVAVTTLADLPAPSAAPARAVDPSTFDRHVGTYADPYNTGQWIVSREGDELHVEAPDLEAYGLTVEPVLEALSSDIFVVTVDGAELDVTFIASEPGGASTYMRNRVFVGTRVTSPTSQDHTDWGHPAVDVWFDQARRAPLPPHVRHLRRLCVFDRTSTKGKPRP